MRFVQEYISRKACGTLLLAQAGVCPDPTSSQRRQDSNGKIPSLCHIPEVVQASGAIGEQSGLRVRQPSDDSTSKECRRHRCSPSHRLSICNPPLNPSNRLAVADRLLPFHLDKAIWLPDRSAVGMLSICSLYAYTIPLLNQGLPYFTPVRPPP